MAEKGKGKAPKIWKAPKATVGELILEGKVVFVGKSLAMMIPQDVVRLLNVERGDFVRVRLGDLEIKRNGHSRSRLVHE